MDITINEKDLSKVAIVNETGVLIHVVQDALNLMSTVSYQTGCKKIVLDKSAFTEEFFDLKTRLAGEILQKYVNYYVKLAIVGNFEVYSSKSLKDFIYESNMGSQFFFLPDKETAVQKLHSVA